MVKTVGKTVVKAQVVAHRVRRVRGAVLMRVASVTVSVTDNVPKQAAKTRVATKQMAIAPNRAPPAPPMTRAARVRQALVAPHIPAACVAVAEFEVIPC